MADQVELLFQFNTEGASQLDVVAKIVEQLGQKSALTGGQINIVEQALNALVKSGSSAQQALQSVALSGASVGKEAASAAKALLEEAAASSAVAAASTSAAAGIRSVGTASEASVPKLAAASAALRGLDGSMNLRAAERFLSTFQGLGPVLQAAFPLFGAVAFVEILEQGVDKVGKLYNAWDPVLKAEKDSLKILQDSTRELESMISKSERLTLETRKRQFGTQFEDREKGDLARLDASEANALVEQIKQQIADARARVLAGTTPATGPSTFVGKGGAEFSRPGQPESLTYDARAAREQIVGLDAKLEDAIYKAKLATQEAAAADADIAKDRTDKSRESARKVDAINKQIEAIKERALALADKAELGTGPLATIEEARRAENRRYANEKADLAVQIRDNRLGGPDTVRTPQSSFDALGRAQDAAHTQALAALDTEKITAQAKAAADYADAVNKVRGEWEKLDQEIAKDKFSAAEAKIRAMVKAHEDLVKAAEKSNKVADLGDKADEAGLQLQFRKVTTLANLAAPIGSTSGALDAAASAYQQRLALIKQIDAIEQRGIDREAALSALKGDEYNKDLAVAQERLKLTQEEGEAAVDYAIKVAEIERKRLEDARTAAGKVFDALVASGHASFADFVKGIALTQGRAIFQNVTEGLFKSTSATLGGIISKDSPLAGLFKGTLLEPQEKTALDVHTQAMLTHTKALLLASGVGGAGVTGALAGSLPLNLGGGTAAGLIGLFGSDVNGITGQGSLTSSGGVLDKVVGKSVTSTIGQILGGAALIPAGGLFAGISGTYTKPGGGYAAQLSTAQRVGNIAGSAGAVATGAYGVYQGIEEGGARGATGAIGSALGVAALIPGPQQPFVMAAALIAGMVKGLLPDPKSAFDNAQNKILNNNKFITPDPLSGQFDVATGANSTAIATRWAPSPVVAGSDVINNNSRGQTRVIVQNNTTVHLNALDYDSLASRADDLAKVIGDATRAGNPDMQIGINRVVFGPGAA